VFRRNITGEPRRTRPSVEHLEDRQLLTGGPTPLTFHLSPSHPEGIVVDHVQVVNVFWGRDFHTGDSLHASVPYLNQFTKDLVGGPFMDVLGQYGVGHGHFQGSRLMGWVPRGGFISDTTIQAALERLLNSHELPAPGPEELYMVYLPPGVTIGEPGYHENNWTAGFDAGGKEVYHDFNFAAISWAKGELGNTVVASHEVAEAVTDPRVGAGWYNDAAWLSGKGGEVADLAVPNTATLHGYKVTQLYSNEAGGLVSP
jgi:hypothetical protein